MQKTTIKTKLGISVPTNTSTTDLLHQRLTDSCKKEAKRLTTQGKVGFCETISSWNVRSYIHKGSPTKLPNHELNKDGVTPADMLT